ncbi:MAG: sigma-70 family RNA polymerase sigma factor [Planctomycetes bacterium]|nr:sigma-70 family RNA polymerase sigma factor [Planctomycetota bacterium]
MGSPAPDPAATTRLLRAMAAGDGAAADQLLPLVYQELHRLAQRLMGHERRDHTLQATALLHEAWLRLCEPGGDFQDRQHFVRIAARAMRHVLVDHARARLAHKRGGGRRTDVDAEALAAPADPASLLAVDETLARLQQLDPQLAQLVELRFFAGLDNPAVAATLGVSLRSVERGWRTARAFLLRDLEPRPRPHG